MQEMEVRWMGNEVDEFERLIRGLRRDETSARRQLSNLVRQREGLALFCNGISNAKTQAALRKSLATLTQSATIEHILQAYVPSLSADEFISHDRWRGIIQEDGSLVEAPLVLDTGAEDSEVSVCRARLEQGWGQILKNLRQGQRLSARDVDSFQESVTEYTVAAQHILRRAPRMSRIHGQRHVDELKKLTEKLKDPSGQVTLSRSVNPNATAFPGGVVADLIAHILENHLSVRMGGRAHASLVALNEDLKSELDELVAIAEHRVETYKSQNPAQNAALKARAAETLIPPGPAGINSPRYGNPLPKRPNHYAGPDLAGKELLDPEMLPMIGVAADDAAELNTLRGQP